MAAGDALLELRAPYGTPPASAYATLGVLAGGSSPAENIYYYAFDASATEYMDFRCVMPGQYAGGGLALECEVHMASATSGGVRVEAAVRYLAAGEAINGTHTYSFNGVTVNAPATLHHKASGTILFTGVEADSWPAEGEAIIRVRRKHDHAGDTASGDMRLACIYVRERSTGE